jgi:hypothetical protein
VVVHALQNPNFIRDWRISSIILDSLYSIPIASVWEVKKIKRSVNLCAHSVVRWAVAGSHSGSIPISSIPSLLIPFLSVFCSSFLVCCVGVLLLKNNNNNNTKKGHKFLQHSL